MTLEDNSLPRIALIVSRFHLNLTQQLLDGAVQQLCEVGLSEDDICIFWVPGAVEIPIVAQRLAASSAFDAIIALGAVIRGETDHYDYVCEQVSQGCQRVALDCEVPVIFGVLTTQSQAQALDRLNADGERGHKGRDAAIAALETLICLNEIDQTYLYVDDEPQICDADVMNEAIKFKE